MTSNCYPPGSTPFTRHFLSAYFDWSIIIILLSMCDFVCDFCFRKLLLSLESQTKANHECNVIFFVPGQYKVDIQCSAASDNNNTMISDSSQHQHGGHVWRFTPPINILVS